MGTIFLEIHSTQFVKGTLDRIKSILFDLYGSEKGERNYRYLVKASADYLKSLSPYEREQLKLFNPKEPYTHLKGKIFAISYPDNIYTGNEHTFKTLSRVLKKYFPGINGIHILPERLMSHEDVWPQDFFKFLSLDNALSFIRFLQEDGYIDTQGILTEKYGDNRPELLKEKIPVWLKEQGVQGESLSGKITAVLESAYNSHFNDGGFSQKTRSKIDPRFGTLDDLKDITSSFSVMLDYVVNHLDIDNEYLENYRRGKNNGDAFIIIDPVEYEEMKANGMLAKTFRPRPFPLFTGVRKYPENQYTDLQQKAAAVNEFFAGNGLKPLDDRVILFLSIYFKVRNDQGLTAEDTRILTRFTGYLEERKIPPGSIFTQSQVQPSGKMFVPEIAEGLPALVTALGIDKKYGSVFTRHDDKVFGEKFFVYTTFSESQADINPVTEAGFRMIIDDLFHLLSSGHLAMMRMDAIKYLWKEKGKKNFDMEEGNKLIEVISRVMRLTAPGVLPLDEVNSPDPVVYEMEKGGGFAYLFGQVNAAVCSFNEGTLRPLERFYHLFKTKRPDNFVPFIMLSTHDGRSVQGLGVQRTDGHVSVEQFYRLKEIIEDQGGKAKFRSVPRGKIAGNTFDKVVSEAGLGAFREKLLTLFIPESVSDGEMLELIDKNLDRTGLLDRIASLCGTGREKLLRIPAIDYFLDWIVDGKTVYELCATSRSALLLDRNGAVLPPVLEARRFALAQTFVLTFGQAVPAIYFNDLLGLTNDKEGFKRSGKPRDLNRHKSSLETFESSLKTDPFRVVYYPLLNRVLDIRRKDPSFYPGSKNFEFTALKNEVFLNHSYHNGNHSFVVGNISDSPVDCTVDFNLLSDCSGLSGGLKDQLTGTMYTLSADGKIHLDLEPYGLLWLSEGVL